MKIGKVAEIVTYVRGEDGRLAYTSDIENPKAELFAVKYQGCPFSDFTLDFKTAEDARRVAWALNDTYEEGIQAAKRELRTWLNS